MSKKAESGYTAGRNSAWGYVRMLLTIDVTGRCNLRCATCYNAEFLPTEIESEHYRRIIRETPPEWEFYFLGGEPLLRRDFIELLCLARDHGHQTSFSTNATLIDNREKADQIIDTDVSSIYVSLDGATAESNDRVRGVGTFRKVLDGLKLLNDAIEAKNAYTKLCISVTATEDNLSDIPGIPRMLDALGIFVEKLGVVPVSTTGRAEGRHDLKVNPASWLRACEEMCNEWRNFERLCFLCLPNSELTIRYLSNKFDLILPESVADCPVLQKRDVGRVLPTGEVVPCSGRLDLIRRFDSENSNCGTSTIGQLIELKNDVFSPFAKHFSNFDKPSDRVCDDCSYFSNCQICPLENSMVSESRNNRSAVCEHTLRELARSLNERTGESLKTLHSVAARQRPTGIPYRKKRRHGDVVFFFPAQERFVFLNERIADAVQLLVDSRSITETIMRCQLRNQTASQSVLSTKTALLAMEEVGYSVERCVQ